MEECGRRVCGLNEVLSGNLTGAIKKNEEPQVAGDRAEVRTEYRQNKNLERYV
jgi:hypothetical protein